MSGKRSKQIRRLAKEQNALKEGTEYQGIETKKMVYQTDAQGVTRAGQIVKTTVVNVNRISYRRLKKALKTNAE